MKRAVKWLALALTSVLVLSLFSGCEMLEALDLDKLGQDIGGMLDEGFMGGGDSAGQDDRMNGFSATTAPDFIYSVPVETDAPTTVPVAATAPPAKEYKRMNLIDCAISADSINAAEDIVWGSAQTMDGTRYPNGLTFWVRNSPGYVFHEEITYRVEEGYTTLNAVAAVGVKSGSSGVSFSVFGDGHLLFTTRYLHNTETHEFSLDITGVRELQIRCDTNSDKDTFGILSAHLTNE